MAVVTTANSSWISGGDPQCGNNGFTAMVWTRPASSSQNGTMFGFPGGLGGMMTQGAASPSHSAGNRLVGSAPGVYWSASAFTVAQDVWSHCAWSVGNGSSDHWFLYKDGVAEDMGAGGGINASNTFWGMARKYESGSWNDGNSGRFAYLKVWNKQLTSAQIAMEKRSRVPLFELADLKIYIPFDNIALPTTFPDISGNGMNGTINGTPTLADGPCLG